ncbi:MAG: hypothetical protein JWO78_1335 [Micavibrio sp.]|nr:hypothetical protein [Micavibrio sp.]
MAEQSNTKIILPVGYENNPALIARAFEKGCGGVIVDGAVPAIVLAELEAISLTPEQRNGSRYASQFYMACRNGLTQEIDWDERYKGLSLPETGRWLAEEIKWVIAAGMGRGRDKIADGQKLMSVWLNAAVATGWHIDRQKSLVKPDMHLHIHGQGLMIASPECRAALSMKKSSAAYVLPDNPLSAEGSQDQMLRERGFKITELRPGQKLFFKDQCLHRSGIGAPDQVKIRGAMF